MQDSRLPFDLEELELERLLASGPRPEPSAALRQRVLGSMYAELHREGAWSRWRFAAACAAVLLVGLGLSLGVQQAAGDAFQHAASPPSVAEVARRLQELAPGLSREDSLRQATLRNIVAEVRGQTPLGEIPAERGSL